MTVEILLWFESIRTPLLDHLFLAITFLGQQELLIGGFCVLYWLVDKKLAYRIGASAFVAIGMNQLMKNTFAIARPFIRWPQLTPVEAALPSATSYSFPSGHTANAVAVYGMAGSLTQGFWRITFWVLPWLVGLSRLYLGVHTLSDVLVSMAIGIPLAASVALLAEACESGRIKPILLFVAAIFGAALLVFIGYRSPGSSSPIESLDSFKSAGAIAGFAIGYLVEHRWIRHSPSGSLVLQTQKIVLGVSGVILLMVTAKMPLNNLLGEQIGSLMRYGLVSFWIVAGLPAIAKMIKPRRVC